MRSLVDITWVSNIHIYIRRLQLYALLLIHNFIIHVFLVFPLKRRNETFYFRRLVAGYHHFLFCLCSGTGCRMGVVQTGIPEAVFNGNGRNWEARPTIFITFFWSQEGYNTLIITTYTFSKLYIPMLLCRREVWEANLDYINQHNEEFSRGEHSYNLGLNEFADLVKIIFQESTLFVIWIVWNSKDLNYSKKYSAGREICLHLYLFEHDLFLKRTKFRLKKKEEILFQN